MDTFFSNEFLDMLVRFLICVLVVWIIIDRFYSAKSKRRDFYFTFMLISIAIFFIVFFMIFVLEDMKGKTSMGIGIGLFGIFSIMRYRTDSMPVREMTYLFVTICLSVVNALAVSMSYYELVATNIIFIISVWLCEKRLKLSPSKLIQYDRIELIKPERREELVENLKERTGLDAVATTEVHECLIHSVFALDADAQRAGLPLGSTRFRSGDGGALGYRQDGGGSYLHQDALSRMDGVFKGMNLPCAFVSQGVVA